MIRGMPTGSQVRYGFSAAGSHVARTARAASVSGYSGAAPATSRNSGKLAGLAMLELQTRNISLPMPRDAGEFSPSVAMAPAAPSRSSDQRAGRARPENQLNPVRQEHVQREQAVCPLPPGPTGDLHTVAGIHQPRAQAHPTQDAHGVALHVPGFSVRRLHREVHVGVAPDDFGDLARQFDHRIHVEVNARRMMAERSG